MYIWTKQKNNKIMNEKIKKTMSKKRWLWYQNEIIRLQKIDHQTTLRVQHQLNVMDQKKKNHGR
tara:strand:- start:131 stop:322 length:192 start_codon:yes stop_codon:yes gene_type:complete